MSDTLTFSTVYDYDPTGLGVEVPLTLRSGSRFVDLRAKIDCGSTYCVFRRATGIRLGLDIESGVPQWIGTATGQFLAYGHEVTLTVLDFETTSIVYFAAEEHMNRNILGRIGWLNRVRFGLIDYDSRLYLSDYNDPA